VIVVGDTECDDVYGYKGKLLSYLRGQLINKDICVVMHFLYVNL